MEIGVLIMYVENPKGKNKLILDELRKEPKTYNDLKKSVGDIRTNINNLLLSKKIRIVNIDPNSKRFSCNNITFEAVPENMFILSNIRETIFQLTDPNPENRDIARNNFIELIENKIKELESQEEQQWKSQINSIELKPLNDRDKSLLSMKEKIINKDYEKISSSKNFSFLQLTDDPVTDNKEDFESCIKELEKKEGYVYHISLSGTFQGNLISKEQVEDISAKKNYLKQMGIEPPEKISSYERNELITKTIFFIENCIIDLNHLDKSNQKEAKIRIMQLSFGLSNLQGSLNAFKDFINEMEKWYKIIQ